jgi:hypothetical protein
MLLWFCIIALIWTFVSTSSVFVFAGHPMIVDSASIVDFKTCQLESWMERNSESATFWNLPACNFTGNLELTVGTEAEVVSLCMHSLKSSDKNEVIRFFISASGIGLSLNDYRLMPLTVTASEVFPMVIFFPSASVFLACRSYPEKE